MVLAHELCKKAAKRVHPLPFPAGDIFAKSGNLQNVCIILGKFGSKGMIEQDI